MILPPKIRTEKKTYVKCPICGFAPSKRNPMVTYHISYNPELVVMACKYCNFTEFLLRNKIERDYNFLNQKRTNAVKKYQEKFGQKI